MDIVKIDPFLYGYFLDGTLEHSERTGLALLHAAKNIEIRFSRGKQADPQHPNRPKGAGLGLSIVKVIGDAHGGHAYVESTVGLGSIFGLEIPAPEEEHTENT